MVPEVVSEVFSKALTPANMTAGFAKTGTHLHKKNWLEVKVESFVQPCRVYALCALHLQQFIIIIIIIFDDVIQKLAISTSSSTGFGSLDPCVAGVQEEQLLAAAKESSKREPPADPKIADILKLPQPQKKKMRLKQKAGPREIQGGYWKQGFINPRGDTDITVATCAKKAGPSRQRDTWNERSKVDHRPASNFVDRSRISLSIVQKSGCRTF